MDTRLLALPLLIAVPATLILTATWGANALAGRLARRHAARPRFTPQERQRLRTLRARYRQDRWRE